MSELGGDLTRLSSLLADRVVQLAAAAEARVSEWRWAYGNPVPHRLEPLFHERVWCWRGGFTDEPAATRYGFDERGEIALTVAEYPGGGELWRATELILREPGFVVVASYGHPVSERPRLLAFARYTLEHGRPVRTEYVGSFADPDDRGEERYRYDGERLVEIDEYEGIAWTLDVESYRERTAEVGGVLHYDGTVLRSGDDVVWEPGTGRVEQAVDEYTTRCIDLLRGFTEQPVDTLWLDHYSQHGIQATLYVGHPGRADRWELRDHAGDFYDEDVAPLRELALAFEDPVLEAVEAVARRLAHHDWTGILPVTDDFAVFVAEHSDEPDEKEASLRRINPPEIVERWLR